MVLDWEHNCASSLSACLPASDQQEQCLHSMINVQLAFPVAQCLKLTSRQCLTLCFLCTVFSVLIFVPGMGAWELGRSLHSYLSCKLIWHHHTPESGYSLEASGNIMT